MNDLIEMVCKNCGPLARKDIFIRERKKNGKIYISKECKICISKRLKEARIKNPQKFKKHAEKYRYIKRDSNIKELKCSKCQIIKSIEYFNPHMLVIRYPYCRDCRVNATKDHHSKDVSKQKHQIWYMTKYKTVARNTHYLKSYGITLDEYNIISENQNNLCAICKKPETIKKRIGDSFLSVDHCHSKEDEGLIRIRGLLCMRCNQGLGFFLESSELCIAAAEYLKEGK